MTSFQHESHYPDPAVYAKHALTTRAVSRNGTLVAQLPSMDPTPGDNDAIFLHPPFSDFPDAHKHREGLTYAVLAVNPDWFLDATDYQQLNGENSSGVRYPAQLEPPRGWCPAKKKEAKESWAEGEEPRLRCTFCRRTYAGVNAKSMWRRHVFEKHKIAMSNRRENQERKGRGSNKENKEDVPRVSERASARGAAKVQLETDPPRPSKLKYRLRTTEDWGKPYASLRRAHSLPQPQEVSDDDEDDSPGTLSQVPAKESDLAAADVFQVGASTTPPLTPGLSPSSSNPQSRLLDLSRSIAESPYDPLLTPAFRHSPARLPSDQPWRFPSPSHPLHGNAREMSLNMLAHIDSSPMLRGLDLSPIVRMSTKEHFKPSIFSSPLSSLMKSNVGASGGGDPSKSSSKPSPRCLFSSGVPTPLVDRFKLKHRIPESPFGREFTPIKPRAFASLTQVTGGAWRNVEHSSAPQAAGGSRPKVQYEGFEPSPYGQEEMREDESIAQADEVVPAAPIFELGQVQYTLPARLISMAVCSDVLVMGLSNNLLVLLELSRDDQIFQIPITRKTTDFTIHKVFLDPSGRHILVTSTQGENWYLYRGWKKARQLKGFKMIIESVAWNKSALLGSSNQTSTREILIGGRNGTIYEAVLDAQEDFFKSQESPDADQVYSLPKTVAWMTAQGIYHGALNFDSTAEDLIDGAQLLPYPTFSTTSSSPRNTSEAGTVPISMALTEFHFVLLYQDRVVGLSTLNDQLTYEDILPLKPNEEVKGITADPVRKTYWVYTDLSMYELGIQNEDRDVWSIYLERGKFDLALQYAKTAKQRDVVMAAQAQAFFTEGRYFQAAQSYSQCSVSFEEVTLKFIDADERDALRSYLISRLERTKRTDLSQRTMLATWLVEFYLSKCNELDDLVASGSVSQDVANLQAERTILEDDLRHFLETYKTNLEPTVIYELIEGHGRTDMYLHYAMVIGDFVRVIEYRIMVEEWTKALDVISRQSDLELYYRFAPTLMRQAPKETVDAWLRQRALDPLRLVPALLRLHHLPRDPLSPNQAIRYLNNVIFDQGNTSPTIHNLIITFYAASPMLSVPLASTVTSTIDTSPSSEDDGPLLRFLSSAPSDPMTGRPYYDLDYALRLCKQTGRVQPCVHIYAKMGLWESSVDLALEKGDLELAKINADMPPEEDRPLRKRLWLKIAQYVVQEKQDIKMAMHFLEDTDLLKIEDILPFFPDFVVIDDFKEEICTALEGYSAHIDMLKSEMDEATRNAEATKKDIEALQRRFITIDAGEKCSSCNLPLLTRQFYVFPCQHTFHTDCLIGQAKECLPASALRKILALQTELVKGTPYTALDRNAAVPPGSRQPTSQRTLLSANFGIPLQNGARAANSLGRNLLSAGDRLRDLIVPDALASVVTAPVAWIPGIGGGKRNTENEEKKAERMRRELEDVLAGSCPLCEGVVGGIDKPFVKEGELDTSWAL
ncbi:hypothetical protein EW026_g2533 [Hermanssonia centrifuga]|uniref:Uncharacterized protein n=1 Tax=Hermanssonia centrifuga TaxID=98765 RepID=A0A4S4KNZ9_9APHY|nr:hypothetical protein EW026_g2533 [Hermanssonia centrifuga]